MQDTRHILKLFRQFFLFGCFTFGGGWGIIAQMEKQFVDQEGVITKEQLLDIISVGRSLPGIMICNTTFLFGYRMGGFLSALACVSGMICAPILILMGVTGIYGLLESQPVVARAMAGVRASVVPIILGSAVRLWNGAFKFPICYLFLAVSFCLYLFFHFSTIVLVLLGAAGGLLVCEYMERRPGK